MAVGSSRGIASPHLPRLISLFAAFLVIPIFPHAGTIKRPLSCLETRLIAKRARERCDRGGCKHSGPPGFSRERRQIKLSPIEKEEGRGESRFYAK